jgi:hypothetical protein
MTTHTNAPIFSALLRQQKQMSRSLQPLAKAYRISPVRAPLDPEDWFDQGAKLVQPSKDGLVPHSNAVKALKHVAEGVRADAEMILKDDGEEADIRYEEVDLLNSLIRYVKVCEMIDTAQRNGL